MARGCGHPYGGFVDCPSCREGGVRAGKRAPQLRTQFHSSRAAILLARLEALVADACISKCVREVSAHRLGEDGKAWRTGVDRAKRG